MRACRLAPASAGLIVLLAAVYLHYGRLPLYHTDLWGHLAYGRWIVEHGRLPETEPFMPMSRGTPLIDTAWLSQVAGFGVWQAAGESGLQCVHGLCVTACCGLLVWAVSQRTGSLVAGVIALAALIAIERFQLRIIRPQMAGLVLYVALLAMLMVPRPPRRALWLIAALFVFWANLHGSFVVGLALLAICLCGRTADLAIRMTIRRGPSQGASLQHIAAAAFRDRRCRRWCGWLLMASAAALVNPYGPRLSLEVARFAQNPNLRDLIEWAPLRFDTWQGQMLVVVTVVTVIATAVARRPIALAQCLPWLLFGLAAIASARMIVWWGPLAAACLALQTHAVVRRIEARAGAPTRSRGNPSLWWSGVAAGAILFALVDSPLARRLPRATAEDRQAGFSRQTPVAAAEWLRSHPPDGMIFAPCEWGDYLLWAGPPDGAVFVTSQAHLVPRQVWQDETAIRNAAPGCLERLDAYGVTAALIDRDRQRELAKRLGASLSWTEVYTDDLAVIFQRIRELRIRKNPLAPG